MRSIAVILVPLLSLVPLYSLSLPINAAHHADGFMNNENCDPTLYKQGHVNSGINCAEMGGVGFQPANTNTNGPICMTNEQARDTQSSGICWMAKNSDSGANKFAAFPSDEGHDKSKADMVKGHRDHRRASVVSTVSIRPLPPIPTPADNALPITQLRPLPKIQDQALEVNARPVVRPRPLPVVPGRRVQGPRPNPKGRRY